MMVLCGDLALTWVGICIGVNGHGYGYGLMVMVMGMGIGIGRRGIRMYHTGMVIGVHTVCPSSNRQNSWGKRRGLYT